MKEKISGSSKFNSKLKRSAAFIRKLKPFFNFSIKSFEDVLCLIIGILVLGVIVFMAATRNLTYDEAYTYMDTGRIQGVWKMYRFGIANTHVLNSLLMSITTLFAPFNDFAIRLPNIITSAIYISIAISFSKKYRNQLLVFGLLVLFYYQVTFISLGRGYGMSVTFMLAAFFVYKSKEDFKRYHIWMAFLFVLAFYANYVAITAIVATAIYMFFKDFNRKFPDFKKKELRWLIGLFAVGVFGFYTVTREGKPLFGAYTQGFFEAVPCDYLSLFYNGHGLSLEIVTLATLILSALIITLFILRKQVGFGVITIINFLIIVLVAKIGDKPLPTGRVLIPFWPLMVFFVIELLEFFPVRKKITKAILRVLNLGVFILLVLNFQGQIEYKELMAQRKDKWKKPVADLAKYQKIEDPSEKYYILKEVKHKIILLGYAHKTS